MAYRPERHRGLTVPGLARTGVGEPLAIRFVEVVKFAVQRYLADDDDQPTVGSNDLRGTLQFDDDTIARIAKLLPSEYFLTAGGSPTTPTDWWYYVNETVAKFRHVTSLDEYFEVRAGIVRSKVITAPWPATMAGESVFSRFGGEVHTSIGDDNVIIGDPGTSGIGSRNVIIKPDADGNVRISGGTAIGQGATAVASSVAIGASASATPNTQWLQLLEELLEQLIASQLIPDEVKADVAAQAEFLEQEAHSPTSGRNVLKAAWLVVSRAADVAGLSALALDVATHMPGLH